MIAGGLRLGPTRRVPQVVRQLAAERALNDRLLEATDGGLELVRRQRPLANKLIKNVRGHRRQGGVGLRWFGVSGASTLLMLCPTHKISDSLSTGTVHRHLALAPCTGTSTGTLHWHLAQGTL